MSWSRKLKKYVIIHDPATGIRKYTFEELSNSFTGIALEIEKMPNFQPLASKNTLSLFDLVKGTLGLNKYLLFLLGLSLSIEVLSLLNPLFMQYVTDSVITSQSKNNLYTLACAFIGLVIIQVYIEYIRGNMVIYLTNNLTEQFSSNLVNHLLMLPLSYFENRQKGDIQSKFLSIDQIQKKISTDFINAVLDGIMIIINVIVMLIYSRLLTGLVCISLLIYFFLRQASYHFLKKQTESSIVQHANANSIFLETLQGILPIKLFLKEKTRFRKWRNSYIKSINSDIKISRINVLYNTTNQLLFNLEHILVICIGATLVLANQFSAGMLIAYLSYRLLLVNKTTSFIQHVFDYKLISIQLRRLSDILFHQPEFINTMVKTHSLIEGALTIKNLSFNYQANQPYILDNINLHIKAGEKIAIIGPSGCGKSTFLKLLMGLLTPASGDIYLDDILISDFGLKNYRELTAAVMQNDTLLSGSILENIVFFEENIPMDEVYQVAKLACIHDTIMQLPMGYETLVGEMGASLSGGQKQRILLARALYKKPKLLFLDEATSHLDSNTEKQINLSLKSLTITQIIIAHRQETIQMADRIIDLSFYTSKNN